MDQAHHRGGTLAGAQAAGEQPVVAANGNGTDLVLDTGSAVLLNGFISSQCLFGMHRSVMNSIPIGGVSLAGCRRH
jgi:hypothetical protein